jgi:hypothetical protein
MLRAIPLSATPNSLRLGSMWWNSRAAAQLSYPQLTAASRLLDEHRLDLASPPHHRLLAAAPAAVVPPSLSNMRALTVDRAAEPSFSEPRGLGVTRPFPSPPTSPPKRPQRESGQPVTHGRLAATDLLCDLRDRPAGVHEPFELISLQRAPRSMRVGVCRLEPMLAHPIADRRRVPARASPDLLERKTLGQERLEMCAIHAPHCLRGRGWNSRTPSCGSARWRSAFATAAAPPEGP